MEINFFENRDYVGQSFGMVPELRDQLNNKQSEGAMTSVASLSSFAGVPSEPAAFEQSKEHRQYFTSSTVKLRSVKIGGSLVQVRCWGVELSLNTDAK